MDVRTQILFWQRILVAASVALACNVAAAGEPTKTSNTTHASVLPNTYAALTANFVFNFYGNNGDGSYNPFSVDNEGFEFYKGKNTHLIFEDGILWGGYHKRSASAKVGGSTYRHGLQPGRIVTPGTLTTDPVADDPANPIYRVYRVRPDIGPTADTSLALATISAEELPYLSRYQQVTAHDILAQYLRDWNEWPAEEGAPFTDLNGDGMYNPAVDIPGVAGASQTLWYVANDMNDTLTENFAGSPPIGLELQRTLWSYKRNMGPINASVFSRVLLINKSGADIDSMYCIQWSDPDVGDASDDFIGCDTLRNLGYAYNGTDSDAVYGTNCPAVGFLLLEGPRVADPLASAIFNGQRLFGYRNLGMTAFNDFYRPEGPVIPANDYVFWYRAMRGLSDAGVPALNPYTSQPTNFCFSGDPEKSPEGSAGWVDGQFGREPGNRIMNVCSGPFSLANGDTQEIVVATIAATGGDRIASVAALKAACDQIQGSADIILLSTDVRSSATGNEPRGITLYQNYPNPFNPSTTIQYTVGGVRNQASGVSNVRMVIYDVLGREVAMLVNERKSPGTYTVVYDGSRLASGVYFYRLTAAGYSAVRKMTIVR